MKADFDKKMTEFSGHVLHFGAFIHGAGAGAGGAGDEAMTSQPAHSHFGAGGVRHDTPFPPANPISAAADP